MKENSKVTRAAGVIGAATFVSRILGFIRDMVVAKVFGATLVADAFFVAFRITNLLRELLAEGSMSAAFIPVFTEYLALRSKEEARELASAVFNLLFFILSGAVLLGIALSPYIVTLLAPGFAADPEKFAMTVYLTRIMFPYMLFIGLAAVTMGVLNSLGSFTAPALSPVMLNVSMIGSALLVSPRMDNPIAGLALGVIFGGMLQLMVQIPPMKKKGMGIRLIWKPAHEGVKRVLRLAVPVVGSLAVTQINIFVSSILASYLVVGSISYLYYATRLYQFPHGIFGIAIATAILPAMSRQAAAEDHGSLRDTLSFGIRYVLFINIPAMVGLAVLGIPITSLLFQRGEFDYQATVGTAYALVFFSAGLWAFSGVRIVNSAFYALKDTGTPVRSALMAATANVVLSLLLMKPLGHGGLALANSLASIFNMLNLLYLFRKKMGPIGLRSILRSSARTVAASAVMGLVCYYMSRSGIWAINGHTLEKAYIVGASVATGIIVYAAMQAAFKSEELAFIIGSFRKRLG
ncbi:MAG TPA: murein biosynthesis integral membrane protein MurJ [Nitrospirota bacterium]